MRAQLNDTSLELDAAALPSKIEEIFDTYISKKVVYSLIEGIDTIKYPIVGAHLIEIILQKEIQSSTESVDKVICEICFSEGGIS